MKHLGFLLCLVGLHAWVPAYADHAQCLQPGCKAVKCLPTCRKAKLGLWR